ncbi:MAG: DUF3325 family protein [Pseudomonadota bacterium]
MELLTLTALLYVASFAFFHASKRRTAFEQVRNSLALQRGLSAFGWLAVTAAFAVAVARYGWEVGIPLWLGCWVLAAILSLFLEALWKRAHIPSAALCFVLSAIGLVLMPWGGCA